MGWGGAGSKKINQRKEVWCNQKALYLGAQIKIQVKIQLQVLIQNKLSKVGCKVVMSVPLPDYLRGHSCFLHVYSSVPCWESGSSCCLGECELSFVHHRKRLERHVLQVIPITDVVHDQQSKCLNELAFVRFGNTDNAKEAEEQSGEMGLNQSRTELAKRSHTQHQANGRSTYVRSHCHGYCDRGCG